MCDRCSCTEPVQLACGWGRATSRKRWYCDNPLSFLYPSPIPAVGLLCLLPGHQLIEPPLPPSDCPSVRKEVMYFVDRVRIDNWNYNPAAREIASGVLSSGIKHAVVGDQFQPVPDDLVASAGQKSPPIWRNSLHLHVLRNRPSLACKSGRNAKALHGDDVVGKVLLGASCLEKYPGISAGK